MATIEQVEKLREKANVSYAEAKEALEKCNGDMLDAILYLEEQGKVGGKKEEPAQGKHFHGHQGGDRGWHREWREQHRQQMREEGKDDFGSLWGKFWNWCKKVFKKGCVNNFEVYKNGEPVVKIPVIVFIMLLVWGFWITIPVMIAGLFCGLRYFFGGPDLEDTDINRAMNKAMDKAADAAEVAKSEIMSAAEKEEQKHKENHNNN